MIFFFYLLMRKMVTYGEDKVKTYKAPLEANKSVKFEEMKIIPAIYALDASSGDLSTWDMEELKKFVSFKVW
jgi:hypothetical protein